MTQDFIEVERDLSEPQVQSQPSPPHANWPRPSVPHLHTSKDSDPTTSLSIHAVHCKCVCAAALGAPHTSQHLLDNQQHLHTKCSLHFQEIC